MKRFVALLTAITGLLTAAGMVVESWRELRDEVETAESWCGEALAAQARYYREHPR